MNLKFRAKANINDEWVYASNVHKVITDDTNEELWVMHPKNAKIEHLGDGFIKYRPLVVNEETIGQYTGKTSVDMTEIYVGDIIKVEMYDGTYENYEIVYDEESAAFEAYNNDRSKFICSSVWDNYEIIGNVNENGDLIKIWEREEKLYKLKCPLTGWYLFASLHGFVYAWQNTDKCSQFTQKEIEALPNQPFVQQLVQVPVE